MSGGVFFMRVWGAGWLGFLAVGWGGVGRSALGLGRSALGVGRSALQGAGGFSLAQSLRFSGHLGSREVWSPPQAVHLGRSAQPSAWWPREAQFPQVEYSALHSFL